MVETGPLFSHAQWHFMVLVRLSGSFSFLLVRIFGGYADFRVIYIFFRGISGILVEAGPIFPHAHWHFMVFSASLRAVFFLTFLPQSQKWSKKRNRGRRGGARKRYIREKALFLEAFKTADPGVGFRQGACRCRILLLLELIYGYMPYFRPRWI